MQIIVESKFLHYEFRRIWSEIIIVTYVHMWRVTDKINIIFVDSIRFWNLSARERY